MAQKKMGNSAVSGSISLSPMMRQAEFMSNDRVRFPLIAQARAEIWKHSNAFLQGPTISIPAGVSAKVVPESNPMDTWPETLVGPLDAVPVWMALRNPTGFSHVINANEPIGYIEFFRTP